MGIYLNNDGKNLTISGDDVMSALRDNCIDIFSTPSHNIYSAEDRCCAGIFYLDRYVDENVALNTGREIGLAADKFGMPVFVTVNSNNTKLIEALDSNQNVFPMEKKQLSQILRITIVAEALKEMQELIGKFGQAEERYTVRSNKCKWLRRNIDATKKDQELINLTRKGYIGES